MRVDELMERMGDKIELSRRSFLLRTEPKTASLDRFVEYTRSWERPAAMDERAVYTTPWASGAEPPSSSLPAQVAWKAASTFGADVGHRYHNALLKAYFTDNRTISDWQILSAIAEEEGIDREAFDGVLEQNRKNFASWVIDEHNSAIQSGINAVPTVVIGDVLPVPGAQDVDQYERLINRFIERRAEARSKDAEVE